MHLSPKSCSLANAKGQNIGPFSSSHGLDSDSGTKRIKWPIARMIFLSCDFPPLFLSYSAVWTRSLCVFNEVAYQLAVQDGADTGDLLFILLGRGLCSRSTTDCRSSGKTSNHTPAIAISAREDLAKTASGHQLRDLRFPRKYVPLKLDALLWKKGLTQNRRSCTYL